MLSLAKTGFIVSEENIFIHFLPHLSTLSVAAVLVEDRGHETQF